MYRPNLNDFVMVYDYFGDKMEIGRVKWLTDDKMAINGIAQNNSEWLFTEFWLDIDKLTFKSFSVIDGSTVWIADKSK